ncbi:transcription and mRNA export factor ENY2 [Manduca sexta]|uniref:Enhancer of yellow 2 transcription factor n=1 Tax=Manduca sexta TaxID=7130 RepID=A0A921YSB6_MANSE|nr:transcription and mRNA export factor ENY2 [Manduca sexta]KAG6444671.1 hypothetical protein O3G_MSEX003490 [Manduca sexta]KAG6444672.1 hypothetical protein O3G_MSEX003490 [Manduca sexta]KAG6444673.1 hypothetical protein O3G_MSEX003490 [Manduca sexta]
MTVHNKNSKMKQVVSAADQKRLSEFMMKRLIECGWEDQLGEIYQKIMEENEGTTLTNEMLLDELNARAPLVPDYVKMELLEKIVECRGGGPYMLDIYSTQQGLQLAFNAVEVHKGGSFDVYVRVNVKRVPA